jgi:hypothetical protein
MALSDQLIDEFKRSWEFIRGMTHEFMECVPDQHWNFSADPTCSPLSKQFRHMVWVTGLYNAAMNSGKTDFSQKKTNYSGGLGKEELIAGLKKSDRDLDETLEALRKKDLSRFEVLHCGLKMGFTEFTHVLIQHESIHQGMWSMYAKKAGFPSPKSWQGNWGL